MQKKQEQSNTQTQTKQNMPKIVSNKINGILMQITQLKPIYTEDTFTDLYMRQQVELEKKIKLRKLSNSFFSFVG